MKLGLPPMIEFEVGNQPFSIHAFDAQEIQQNLDRQAVNVIASGPSIADVDFTALLDTATIFINGSISLTAQHIFTNVVGYVSLDLLEANSYQKITTAMVQKFSAYLPSSLLLNKNK